MYYVLCMLLWCSPRRDYLIYNGYLSADVRVRTRRRGRQRISLAFVPKFLLISQSPHPTSDHIPAENFPRNFPSLW